MKIKRRYKIPLILLVTILVFWIALIQNIDKTEFYKIQPYNAFIDSIETRSIYSCEDSIINIGWSKVNITPTQPTRLAGYMRRPAYSEIKDSVYVRSLVFSNKKQSFAIVSLDLIMVHPSLRDAINKECKTIVDGIYFSATHTHTSLGEWGHGALNELLMGGYNQDLVEFISKQVAISIKKAKSTQEPSNVTYQEIEAHGYGWNRVAQDTTVDDKIRLLKFSTNSGKKALLTSFSAHPTIARKSDFLSADYPGVYSNEIEKNDFDFSMFVAGGVASCSAQLSIIHKADSSYGNVIRYGKKLASHVLSNLKDIDPKKATRIALDSIAVPMPKPQLKITNNKVLRSSIFKSLLGDQKAYLKSFRINDISLIGMPADFSGELGNEILDNTRSKTIFTSFNGAYIGYITHPKYYYSDHEEPKLLNWYGPHNSDYYKIVTTRYLKSLHNH